jgi:hypothetical protein
MEFIKREREKERRREREEKTRHPERSEGSPRAAHERRAG